jgi:hypothetical protein
MSRVRVAGFGLSLDGFGAGIEQSLDDPLGKRGTEIFQWCFHTKSFCTMRGLEGGSTDVDDAFARRSMENFGAFILVATCLVQSVVHGRTTRGRDGGVPIRHTTRRLSF